MFMPQFTAPLLGIVGSKLSFDMVLIFNLNYDVLYDNLCPVFLLLWIHLYRTIKQFFALMRDILVLPNEQIVFMSFMITADKLPCQYCSRTSTLWFYEYTFLSIRVRCISGIIVFLMY